MTDEIDWSDYVDEALKTAPNQSPEMQLVQGALGLCAEVGEFERDPNVDEAGDVAWYLALLDDAGDDVFGWIDWPNLRRVHDMRVGADRIANTVESFAYQGADPDECAAHLEKDIMWTANRLGEICRQEFRSFSFVLAQNLDKLRDRHGEQPPGGET